MLDKLRLILKQARIELIQGFFPLPSLLVTSTPGNTDGAGFLSLCYAIRDLGDCSGDIGLHFRWQDPLLQRCLGIGD